MWKQRPLTLLFCASLALDFNSFGRDQGSSIEIFSVSAEVILAFLPK
jgi:hypothetical protein